MAKQAHEPQITICIAKYVLGISAVGRITKLLLLMHKSYLFYGLFNYLWINKFINIYS